MGRAPSLLWSPMFLASTAAFVCHWEGGEMLMTALHVRKSFCGLSDFFSLGKLPEGKIWLCVISCFSVVCGYFQRYILYVCKGTLDIGTFDIDTWILLGIRLWQQKANKYIIRTAYVRHYVNLMCLISVFVIHIYEPATKIRCCPYS